MDNQDYHNLEESYPSPFAMKNNSNPRELYDRPVEQNARFKVIDDDYISEMKRNQNPQYHTIPNREKIPYIAPYQHAMKRPSNAETMKEIFGNNQNFELMNEIEFDKQGRQVYQPNREQNYQDQAYREQNQQNQDQAYQQNKMYQNQQNQDQNYQQTKMYQNQDQSYQQTKMYQNQQNQDQSYQQTKMYQNQQNQDQNYQQTKMYQNQQDQSYQQNQSHKQTDYIPRMKFIDQEDALSSTFSSKYDKIYNAILEYFPNFVMTKTALFGEFSVYKSVAKCLLCIGTRYIVAIVKKDNLPVGTTKPLSSLEWVSFQTRYSDDDKEQRQFHLTSHQFAKPDKTILDDTIRLSRKTNLSYLYDCDNLPLNIEIIKTKDDEDISEYGTVSSALEIFSTVLSFNE